MVRRQLLMSGVAAGVGIAFASPPEAQTTYDVVEATIESTHAAIESGEVTCTEIVQQYIDRARAYNGVCTALVTEDGADIPPAFGYNRAGSPIEFPTQTVSASTLFPDLDQYQGLPLDFGRMERTVSNPDVYAQMGMRVGIPNAGQINALETLNIRGERSVTCRGEFDAHPSTGPLPAGAPDGCEEFRQQPDALERAADLDAMYGSSPDLASMPLYCLVTGFKDPYDTKDMRTTANNDVNFAMDVPPSDSSLTARLRARGAIIFAKTTAHEFNAGPNDPGGDAEQTTNWVSGGQAVGSWGGQACNPYDTERVPRGSSSGAGASVGANLLMISICEQTASSCQGPASRNGTAMLLASQGLLRGHGGIGNMRYLDRPGILTRTLADATYVLDALNDPASGGHYDSLDPFSAVSRALIPDEPYTAFVISETDLESNSRPLEGLTIGIFREHMRHLTPNHVAMSDQVNNEILTVLRDQLGANLVEISHTDYLEDPEIPNATFTINDALARILPWIMPEILSRRDADGELMFDVPDWDVTSPEYLKALAVGDAPLPGNVTLTGLSNFGALPCGRGCRNVAYLVDLYLAERQDERITDWAAWTENAKFRDDFSRAGAENWAAWQGHGDPGQLDELARSYVGRLALQMMMEENGIDLIVHPENTVPTPKIQGANVGAGSLGGITPFLQIPQVAVPAGMNDIIYEPEFALSGNGTNYMSVLPEDTPQTTMPNPMPVSITFFANQGDEPLLVKVGTAYESATGHRVPPPDFGPIAEN